MFTSAERDRLRELVRSSAEPELCRALAAAMTVALGEIERWDPVLAGRLEPMLAELAAPGEVRALDASGG